MRLNIHTYGLKKSEEEIKCSYHTKHCMSRQILPVTNTGRENRGYLYLSRVSHLFCDYIIYILLLDMSKAFDTVNRNQLFETLEEILLPDEIHLLHITNDVKLKVRVGADYEPEFTTSVGIMQGDCLSAVLFILYLAKALSSRPPLETEHCYSRPPQLARDAPTQLLDHTYAENPNVAPLQPFDMRHSFTVRAKMLMISHMHRHLKTKLI